MRDAASFARDFAQLVRGFDRSEDHVVVTGADGRILYANAAATAHTGYPVADMIGRTPGELWGGHMPPDYYRDLWKTIAVYKQPYSGELHNRRKNGDMYWQRVTIIPVLSEQDAVLYYIGIEMDIDAPTNREAVMSAVLLSDAPAGMRVRWPVGWVLGKGHLTRGELLELQRQYADQEALDQLTADLMALSGVHLADREPSEEFSLSQLVREVLEEVCHRFPGRRCVLEEPQGSVLLREKKRLLRIAVERIIINAAQYTQPGDGAITVTILRADRQYVIRCQDNGIGISLREQRHLFEQFFRGVRARSLHRHGSGLGLYLVKAIADAQSWTVTCVSEEDHGACFDLTIPRGNASEA